MPRMFENNTEKITEQLAVLATGAYNKISHTKLQLMFWKHQTCTKCFCKRQYWQSRLEALQKGIYCNCKYFKLVCCSHYKSSNGHLSFAYRVSHCFHSLEVLSKHSWGWLSTKGHLHDRTQLQMLWYCAYGTAVNAAPLFSKEERWPTMSWGSFSS